MLNDQPAAGRWGEYPRDGHAAGVQWAAYEAPRLINAGLVFRLHPYTAEGQFGIAPASYRTKVLLDVFDVTDEFRREVRFGVEREVGSRLVARAGLISNTPTVGLGARMGNYTLNAGFVMGRTGGHGAETMVSLTSAY